MACGLNPRLDPDMDPLFEKNVFTKGAAILPYRLLKPDGYTEDGTIRYPLVIFLHGIGDRGTDNESQLRNGVEEFAKDATRKRHPNRGTPNSRGSATTRGRRPTRTPRCWIGSSARSRVRRQDDSECLCGA